MAFAATSFQNVFDIVRLWWLTAFVEMRVSGQLALEDDEDIPALVEDDEYHLPFLFDGLFSTARGVERWLWKYISRGSFHSHCVWWGASWQLQGLTYHRAVEFEEHVD